MVPPFVLWYPYNRLKCIIYNYINSGLFTFIFDCRFQLFWIILVDNGAEIVQFVWYFCFLVLTVIFTCSIKTAPKYKKTELIVFCKNIIVVTVFEIYYGGKIWRIISQDTPASYNLKHC
jgi:hypothetical protein